MHSKDARPASFQIQNGGWAMRALIWKKDWIELLLHCFISEAKNFTASILVRPLCCENSLARPLCWSSSRVVKTPACPWEALHWVKWPFFLRAGPSPWQVRCFWLPPPEDCKHDLEWSSGGLVTKQVSGDICSKEEFPRSRDPPIVILNPNLNNSRGSISTRNVPGEPVFWIKSPWLFSAQKWDFFQAKIFWLHRHVEPIWNVDIHLPEKYHVWNSRSHVQACLLITGLCPRDHRVQRQRTHLIHGERRYESKNF